MVLFCKLFYQKNIGLPIVLTVLFFLTGEALNWYIFRFFDYGKLPLGEAVSFWLVIAMYIGLVAVSCLILNQELIIHLFFKEEEFE